MASFVSSIKKLYAHCLVLVGSRNGFERCFKIKLKQLRALWKTDINDKIEIPYK